jgi:hypothetical protein
MEELYILIIISIIVWLLIIIFKIIPL